MDDKPDRTIHLDVPTVAAFVGPTGSGPIGRPSSVASVEAFIAVYGEEPRPSNDRAQAPHFLAHAVRAFLAEGGTRAYVVRAADADGRSTPEAYAAALETLEQQHDVAIVAAPGATYTSAGDQADRLSAAGVVDALIQHAERMRDRFALIDSANGLDVQGVIAERARLASSYAALLYPWVRASDPVSGSNRLLPPSGFVAGVYARNDAARGVWTPPGNEILRSAVGLERAIDAADQEMLGQAGVANLRMVADRGIVLWGSRTTSNDPEWRYVNIRRYATYLERAIGAGLQWVVFEPNGEELWSAVRRDVGDFLLTQWRAGALTGSRPEEAYFVRCDRSTMTQDDLNQGRLNCVIGVALQRPAEFVIFRIGQWTAKRCS
jgi:uncharacterized protein